MQKEIKNIVLDFNGVISVINKKEMLNIANFKDFCNILHFGFSYLTKSGLRKYISKAYNALCVGEASNQDVYDAFDHEFPKHTKVIKSLLDNFVSSMHTREGIINLVRHLRSNGFKVFILSNTSHEMAKLVGSEEIKSHFDGIFCSSDYGLAKPNVDIFESACKLWQINPEESLFVDDKKENVRGALDAGFKTGFTSNNESKIINFITQTALE